MPTLSEETTKDLLKDITALYEACSEAQLCTRKTEVRLNTQLIGLGSILGNAPTNPFAASDVKRFLSGLSADVSAYATPALAGAQLEIGQCDIVLKQLRMEVARLSPEISDDPSLDPIPSLVTTTYMDDDSQLADSNKKVLHDNLLQWQTKKDDAQELAAQAESTLGYVGRLNAVVNNIGAAIEAAKQQEGTMVGGIGGNTTGPTLPR